MSLAASASIRRPAALTAMDRLDPTALTRTTATLRLSAPNLVPEAPVFYKVPRVVLSRHPPKIQSSSHRQSPPTLIPSLRRSNGTQIKRADVTTRRQAPARRAPFVDLTSDSPASSPFLRNSNRRNGSETPDAFNALTRSDAPGGHEITSHSVDACRQVGSQRAAQVVARLVAQAQGIAQVGALTAAAAAAGALLLLLPPVAHAGLVQMPPSELRNDYYLVRAGESEWESANVLHTNPVDKTNVQSGLSAKGKQQAVAAARRVRALGVCEEGCWVWPSIAQRAYQSAEIIAYVNEVTYSRIVPEYSFLDARGVGAFEGQPLEAMGEIYLGDSSSSRWRPPPTTDGTPHESASDVLVRVTQLMSILETQYSGEAVVIVAPDSDCLSVLQAALLGIDLGSHSSLAFQPGEVRQVDLSAANPVREPRVSGLVSLGSFQE